MLEDLGGLDSTSELRVLLSDEDAERVLQEQRDLQAVPTKAQEPSESTPPRTDWFTTAKVLIALIVFIFVLQPLGWILSAAALFWVIAWALGSKRPVFDVGVSLLFASSVQIAFVAGLGPLAETELRRALAVSEGNLGILVGSPITITLYLLLGGAVLISLAGHLRNRSKDRKYRSRAKDSAGQRIG